MNDETKREQETVYAVPELYIWARAGYPIDHRMYSRTMMTPEEAHKTIAEAHFPPGLEIVRATWREREQIEDHRGNVTPPAWHQTSWWIDHTDIHQDHCVKAATSNAAMLSYFQTPTKAAVGVRTVIRPGRYLTKFFSHLLSEKEIARMARWHETGQIDTDFDNPDLYPLHFAADEDEIVEVYATGPRSCMSDDDWDDTGGEHPVQVYAAGDLQIAYLAELATGKPRARALVWPAKKLFGRVYPTPQGCWHQDDFSNEQEAAEMQSALRNRLLDLGYKEADRNGVNSFNGAKLKKIELDNEYTFLMPYLDWGYGVEDCGTYFRMSSGADTKADNTNGTIQFEDNSSRCEHCGSRVADDDECIVYATVSAHGYSRGAQVWCSCCMENYSFRCEGAGEQISVSVPSVEVDGYIYSLHYAFHNFTRSALSGEFIRDADDTVLMGNGETWLTWEYESYGFTDLITGGRYHERDRHPEFPDYHNNHCVTDILADIEARQNTETGAV